MFQDKEKKVLVPWDKTNKQTKKPRVTLSRAISQSIWDFDCFFVSHWCFASEFSFPKRRQMSNPCFAWSILPAFLMVAIQPCHFWGEEFPNALKKKKSLWQFWSTPITRKFFLILSQIYLFATSIYYLHFVFSYNIIKSSLSYLFVPFNIWARL